MRKRKLPLIGYWEHVAEVISVRRDVGCLELRASGPGSAGTVRDNRLRTARWTMDSRGAEWQTLQAGERRQDRFSRFSPSGKWMAYFRADVLHVVSIDGGRNVDLGTPDRGSAARGCQWAPARDELLVDGPAGLNVFTAESGWHGVMRKIVGAGLPVVFSPDGKEIVYGDAFVNGRGPGGEPMRTGRLCRLALDWAAGRGGLVVRLLRLHFMA